MTEQRRMSPMTALFIGLFGLGVVTVGSAAAVIIYSLSIAESKIDKVFSLAENTVANLPEVIEALPENVTALLGRRAPEYIDNVSVDAKLVNDRHGGAYPVVAVNNKGGEVISMLAIRVVALDERGDPVREWTEVVATPLGFNNDLRGPLWPHKVRQVPLRGCRHSGTGGGSDLHTATYEISELRLWEPESAGA